MNKYRLVIYSLAFILIMASVACTCTVVDNKIEYDCYGDLIPCDDATYDLGSPSYYWDTLYVNNIVTVNATCYTDLIPCDNKTYDIGSTTRYWNELYVPSITSDTDLEINCSDNQTLVLTEPVWNDHVVNMSNARKPASLYPTWRGYLQSQVPAFEKDAINVLYFSAQLPHTYKEGTDLEFHIHIVYPSAGVGDSVWYFSYVWKNVGDIYPAVAASTTTIIASPNVADYHQLAQIDAVIDGTGMEVSSVLLCSIQRLGNLGTDTYDDEIYLISGDFHHQVDTMGSRTQLVK